METHKIWKRSLLGLGMTVFILLLIPSGILADFTDITFLAGWYGDGSSSPEDPLCPGETDVAPAKHPQNAAFDDYLVVVYALGTGETDPNEPGEWIFNIRLAISSNQGTSWSNFLWVDQDLNYQQDYPDVQIYQDFSSQGNPIKMVVVWQEKSADDSNEWVIKAREIDTNGNRDATIWTVSDSQDTQPNIYPKVSACSDDSNDRTYWNVVWQRDYYTDRFGVKLRRYVDQNNNPTFCAIDNIEVPSDSDEDFKHPATDCILSANNYQDVFIIYDVYYDGMDEQETDSIIRVKKGYPSGSPTGTFTISNSHNLATSTGGDYALGFPDITVDDPLNNGNNVICVWIMNDGQNTNVNYNRSTNGGGSYTSGGVIATNGDMSLRSAAVEMIIYSSNNYKIAFIWTNGYNIYYKTYDQVGWSSVLNGATTDRSEVFCDVALTYDYVTPPGVWTIYIHAVWQDSGTAVWTGRTT